MKPKIAVRPTPMPDVARAMIYMKDAQEAFDRALSSWNRTQMFDAIRSMETFIQASKDALEKKNGLGNEE